MQYWLFISPLRISASSVLLFPLEFGIWNLRLGFFRRLICRLIIFVILTKINLAMKRLFFTLLSFYFAVPAMDKLWLMLQW